MATAFAVFCADDGSLTFYKRDTVPAVGDEFEGKVVGAVYTGFETSVYNSASNVPWYNEKASILSVSFVDEIAPAYTKHWFNDATAMISFDTTNLNTSNVKNMCSMFSDCSGLTALDVSNFNTSKVTDMQGMFSNCSGLTSLDLSNFDTSSVTSMTNMFYNCSGLTSLDLSNFNTSNVTSMMQMFIKCSNLTSLDVSSFDTSKVKNMGMNNMFSYCSNLISLDLSSFNTSNVTNIGGMFYSCSGLTIIYVSERWSTAAVTNSTGMFNNCTSLVGDIPFDSSATDATYATYTGGYLTYKFYADYLKDRFVIDGAELFDIGNKIRTLTGVKEGMTSAEMVTAVDTFNTEIADVLTTQDDLIAQIIAALASKGYTT